MTLDLGLVAFSLFTWGVGEGMFIFFQTIYLQKWGADPIAIGTILSVMGIAMTVAQAPAGYLADRLGRRPVMWFSWILGSFSAGVMALATTLPVFITGLLLYGLTSFLLAPMNSYIAGARGKWSVGRALTLTSALYNLGAVIGPLIGGQIGQKFGLKTVYMISACILVLSTIIVFFVKPQQIQRHSESEQRTKLFQNQRFLGYLGIVFITIFATYLPQPLTPNFLQTERGISLAAIGQLGSMGSLGSALIAIFLGRMTSGLALWIGQLMVGGFALLIWKGTGLPWYAAGYFLIGGYRLCRSMTLAHSRPLIHAAEIGLAFGVVETVNSSAFILAPITAGFLYQQSPTWVYIASLVVIGISLLVSGWFIFKTEKSLPSLAEVHSEVLLD
jgi:MFS family permease